MPLVRILEDYSAAEGYIPGDVVDITNIEHLLKEGKVELVDPETPPVRLEPVAVEPTEGSQPEGAEETFEDVPAPQETEEVTEPAVEAVAEPVVETPVVVPVEAPVTTPEEITEVTDTTDAVEVSAKN